ncbi:MAG TPA: hypothetical protein VGT24_04750 [Candidatus Acidoferrales bacterium]|nr:hypothetical protein [Candidatus Acidoferrales bacterium]
MRFARVIGLALTAVLFLFTPIQPRAQVAVGISVTFGPPALPVYEQPICPGEGYIWTPGYWAYGDVGYYWVPGTWVLAPVGMLWTPGYWAWEDEAYYWHAGYWGPEVGFYGGIFYGFGYTGRGYEGGYWNRGAFYYNRSVNNVTNVTNVYNKTVNNNVTVNNVSYNGGPGGTSARPTAAEQSAARMPHTSAIPTQIQHEREAGANRSQFASVNHGKPEVAATVRPAEFSARGAVSAKAAAPYNPVPARSAAQPEKSNRPENFPARPNPEPSNPRQPTLRPENSARGVNPQVDMKRQQDLQKLQDKQNQERQKMESQHQQEMQKLQQRGADQRQQQALQQKHQQQTQQLEQKHTQQMEKAQPKPQQERTQPKLQQEQKKQ